MEIFVLLKKLLVVIGFRNANHPNKEAIKLFLRMTTIALLVTGGTTSSYFGIIKTKTFAEVAETFAFVNMMCYSTSSQLAFWVRWSSLKRIMESMQDKICERLSTFFFWQFGNPEGLYRSSKLVCCAIQGERDLTRELYAKATATVENFTKKGTIAMLAFTIPFFIVPTAIQSYYQYYKTGAAESFELPFHAA